VSPSTFDTLAAEAAADLDGEFGEALTHTDADGVATAATGTFLELPPTEPAGRDGQDELRHATATLPVADVAAVQRGDTLARGAETWTVESALKVLGDSRWEMHLVRSRTLEKSRENYRLRR
jgi:hypothetical protein